MRAPRLILAEATSDLAHETIALADQTARKAGQESEPTAFVDARTILGRLEEAVAEVVQRAQEMWVALTADRAATARLKAHQAAEDARYPELADGSATPGSGEAAPARGRTEPMPPDPLTPGLERK